MWCLSAGTGRLTFIQWVQKRHEFKVLFVSSVLESHSSYFFSNSSIHPLYCIHLLCYYQLKQQKWAIPCCMNDTCPCLVNKMFYVQIECSTSYYFYGTNIKYHWCVKCLLFAVFSSGHTWGPSSCPEAAAFVAGWSGDQWTQNCPE